MFSFQTVWPFPQFHVLITTHLLRKIKYILTGLQGVCWMRHQPMPLHCHLLLSAPPNPAFCLRTGSRFLSSCFSCFPAFYFVVVLSFKYLSFPPTCHFFYKALFISSPQIGRERSTLWTYLFFDYIAFIVWITCVQLVVITPFGRSCTRWKTLWDEEHISFWCLLQGCTQDITKKLAFT